ncbi:MAG: DUF2017 family protein [Acidimicrobiales bacterium]
MIRRRFVPERDSDGVVLKLPKSERALLSGLAEELSGALDTFSGSASGPGEVPESMRRLFPHAYAIDEEAEARFCELTRSELLEHHRHAFEVLAASADAPRLSGAELDGWMAALTDLRLVLGTVLGVTDEEGAPSGLFKSSQGVIYGYLSALQEELVGVLSGSLPPATPGADDLAPDDPWGEPLGDLRWDGSQRPSGPEPS